MNSLPAIGVGVLGATGYIGQPYRAEIRAAADARIVALCARRRDLLDAAGLEDGADLLTADWRAVVDHPKVDLVVVGTPDAHHYEAVMAAAQAGKHVLCEKPVGMNSTEAEEMWRAYQSAGSLAHYVPFWTRYAAIFRKMKDIVDSGQLGEIRGVMYRWHNPRPADMPHTWRDDPQLSAAGSIADVGSHACDTVCWLLGSQIRRVLSHAATVTRTRADLGQLSLGEALLAGSVDQSRSAQRSNGTPDYANISWEFSNGAVGALTVSHATFFRKGLCPELELHGSKASVAVNRVTGDVLFGRPDELPERIASIPNTGFGNRFEKYVFPVVRRVMAGERPGEHPNLETGWRVQCFTDAVTRSAAEGAWADVKND